MSRISRLVDAMRLAAIGAWRGRERGMAVFAGVFLASLVITTVLAYGSGLSQIFFQESLKSEAFDAKLEFRDAPVLGQEGWTNSTDTLIEICDELDDRSEIADCTVIIGARGTHSGFTFGNEDVFRAMPLLMDSINSSSNLNWSTVDFAYPELAEAGPPITMERAIEFLGPGGFDGVIADRLGGYLIQDMGTWLSAEEMAEQRGVYLPSTVATAAGASVGDSLDNLTFMYTAESRSWSEAPFEEDECGGEVYSIPETGFSHCQYPVTVENMTIVGIYEPWDLGNPTLPENPVFASWSVLNESTRVTLMDNDHVYLGLSLDRSQLPTESTSEAADWLEALGRDIQEQNYTDENVEFIYIDIVSGTIVFLNIFLGLIQVFDYILMIPIVLLSLSVLVYGLVLSLEQRRREVSIHRVIGATSKGLGRMVLTELFVMSSLAWLAGYLLAMATVPVVLASVGFMEFSALKYSVDPSIGLVLTSITALSTIGLALIFGRGKARDFLEMEIDEGVSKVREVAKPKVWLHWLMFLVGMVAVIDTWMEMNVNDDGIISSWLLEGVMGIFAPFLLWIGGALLLGRLGAKGPKIMQFFLGRTPLLSDVKRGLAGSGSTESVNRLAVIMLLTLSIVTLAAVQGYTGTIVDERTASVETGSDLSVTMEEASSAGEVEAAIRDVAGSDVSISVSAVNIPNIQLMSADDDAFQTWVLLDEGASVLHWYDQAVPGKDVDAALTAWDGMTFSAGEDAAYTLDLFGSGRGGNGGGGNRDILLSVEDAETDNVSFTWHEVGFDFATMSPTVTQHNETLRYIGIHQFIPGIATAGMEDALIIGEPAYRAFVGDDAVDNLTAKEWVVKVEGVEGEALSALRVQLESDGRFTEAQDWNTAHESVERNGGLIFGTPGLLSLQFVVASIAAVASAFVFLSLVLNQRQKELAVLQAIGASPNQIIRLVLFEILSIVIVSMALGMLLGMGLAMSFNALFEVFGFIFQIFGGSSTVITRDLVWPWKELGIVGASVFIAVVAALLMTTRKALASDLASVLKGE